MGAMRAGHHMKHRALAGTVRTDQHHRFLLAGQLDVEHEVAQPRTDVGAPARPGGHCEVLVSCELGYVCVEVMWCSGSVVVDFR